MPIDYEAARRLLEELFAQAEAHVIQGSSPSAPELIRDACDLIFRSRTQAYREVLLGCAIARALDKSINIRLPYADQGPNAFSGRSLDERVINPFLQDKRIPSSKGPYLSVFRRSVRFDASTRPGLRDTAGYDAFLQLVDHLEAATDRRSLRAFLLHLLYEFAKLREAANVSLARLQRLSLDQYSELISGLLATPSGGRFPVLLVVATLIAIKEFFAQDWTISWQGINVADNASGAGGDITIAAKDRTLLAAEVTERPVDRSRVVATFNTKIAPAGLEEYLFFLKGTEPAPEARQQAQRYFSQGHELNFVEIKEWILMSLATMGRTGRAIFNKVLAELLDGPEVPRTLKVAWNDQISRLTS